MTGVVNNRSTIGNAWAKFNQTKKVSSNNNYEIRLKEIKEQINKKQAEAMTKVEKNENGARENLSIVQKLIEERVKIENNRAAAKAKAAKEADGKNS